MKNEEKAIYKSALSRVEDTNRALLQLFEESKERIEAEILKVQTRLLSGGTVSAFKQERLQSLYNAINVEIEKLRRQSVSRITLQYGNVYQSTYYREAFEIEREINTTLKLGKDYFLRFPEINVNAARAALNEVVAGNTFLQRSELIRDELRFRVRQAVSQNIIEGQTVQQLAKNLRILDEAYDMGIARVTTMARTELLTAYSLGQEEATHQAELAGVEFNYTWSAAMTKNTRPTHARADGQKALIIKGKPVFTVGGIKFRSPRVLAIPNQENAVKEIANCRCRRQNNPYGIKPTARVAQREDGSWAQVNGDMTAKEWAKREYGVNV